MRTCHGRICLRCWVDLLPLSLSPPRSCLSFLSHSRIRVTRLAPRTTVLLLVVEKQRVGGPHRRFPSRASFFPLPRSASSSSVCFLFSLVYVLVRKLHRAGCLPFILPSVILPSSAAGIRDTATLSATASSTPTTTMPTGASRLIASPRTLMTDCQREFHCSVVL